MQFTYYALDNEFAVSTGSNVNSGNGTSTFDYPPTATMDLVITSSGTDDDARLFEVGDTYTVSFVGQGGTTIEDATVIRSDPISGNQGAVVFEGLNPSGDLVQVVWSPNFDLEQWYFNNFNQGQSPQFYTTDQSATTYRYACFAAGTLIETADGPRRVQDIHSGDLVWTLDHGLQPVKWHAASIVPGLGRGAPVIIAAGFEGARTDLTVSPQHRILMSHPLAELYFGSAEVLVPAVALVDGVTVRRENRGMMRYHHLLLDRHEIIVSNGTQAETMLIGDNIDGVVGPDAAADFEDRFARNIDAMPKMATARPVITRREAMVLRDALGLQRHDTSVAPPTFLFAA